MNKRVRFSFLRDKRAQRTWLALVLAWVVIRTLVIRDVFGAYGVNPWIYFLIDLFSAVPYAILSGRAVVNFLDKNWASFRRNGFFTLFFFYMPDMYVLSTAEEPPTSLLIGFLLSIVSLVDLHFMGFVETSRRLIKSHEDSLNWF
jgi:hypothetical protein